MKNVIKKNSKLIIAFSLGFILSIGTVFAASKLYAVKVSVDTTNMPALGSESNVEEALTYLYQRAADAGLTGTGNHSVVPTKYRNVYETYLDPTNLSRKCTAAEVVSTTGTNSGCMKWYIYDWSDTNYTMLLDHSIGEATSYGGTNYYTVLETATSSWDNRLLIRRITTGELSYLGSDSDTRSTSSCFGCNKYYTMSYFGGGENPLSWVFNGLVGCKNYGCTNEDSSAGSEYWTAYSNNAVHSSGSVSSHGGTAKERPVIEISKAIF